MSAVRDHSALGTQHSSLKNLLGLEGLDPPTLNRILDLAETFVGVGEGTSPKRDDLKGAVVANLFFEPSTRTRTSFGLAARRLGADTVDFSPGGSSLSKGESFIDTAKNIEAMGVTAVVVRHSSAGRSISRADGARCGSTTSRRAPTRGACPRTVVCSASPPTAGRSGRMPRRWTG